MNDYEKLGAFYLGRTWDPQTGRARDEDLLYDSKDLTTHALCVGMTGSGKTGLCVGLLEEAAIDGIPAIAIDPKGDLANLCLTFPGLSAAEFRPWIDPGEATRKGQTPDQFAAATAKLWKEGLADWGQDGARIRRFADSVDRAIYTPGSLAGRPLRVLRSLAAPSAELIADGDALRDRILAAVSGLLSLLGIDADPVRSREHILISNLLDRAWRAGRSLELAGLIAEIQDPPFERLGVLDLESFFPAGDRFELAMGLNSLLASPGFAAWMEGEPLEAGRLLYTADGRPRLSILSIAHLSDRERMFFVTQVLNELISWMRAQPGTSSLRAILYMDEIFGYFPPTAEPPSKRPMLTLLKQARAYGVGVVLATQNPVDLDYKGLSNCGTWFLGRLQTERDKARVLDGLEGAMAGAGARFDRAELDRTLSGLGKRVFLMNDVHEDGPALFQTRWALSYLRGPLTRDQIATLNADAAPSTLARAAPADPTTATAPTTEPLPAEEARAAGRPMLPPEVPERFLACALPAPAGASLVYRPALLAHARVHYVDRRADVDHWEEAHWLVPLGESTGADPWDDAEVLPEPPAFDVREPEGAKFAAPPAAAARAKSYAAWAKKLAADIYRTRRLPLLRAPTLKRYSRPGVGEGEFRAGLRHAVHERRDLAIEKLRKRYAPKLGRLRDRMATAQERVEREQDQVQSQKLQTVVSMGATVLGALFGRKLGSVGNVGRATTAARGVGRIGKERADVARAQEKLADLQQKLEELQEEFDEAIAEQEDAAAAGDVEVTEHPVKPRKSDISVESVVLAWTPWWVSPEGIAERGF